jgi:glycosyltransferase involved in cell wall biosynthesis
MKVSVIVPTRNSERTLAACLRSIREQTHDEIELVVVDNQSVDSTMTIAESLADVVVSGGRERSAQRNHGARLAKGAAFLFIDSDMVLDSAVVAECVEEGARGAEMVIVPEESVGEGFWARCRTLERSCYVGDTSIEAARFFRRQLIERVGGYDENLVGSEDWDLHERAQRTGARVSRTTALIRHDEGALRLRHLLVKKFHYGKTLGAYVRKHPSRARDQLRLFRPAFVRHRRRLLRSPHLAFGIAVMKTAEAMAGAAGLLVATLRARIS